MKLEAWLMLVFACAVLFGGLAFCVRVAILKERRDREQGVDFSVGDDGGEE